MGTYGNVMFHYLLIICKFTNVKILGDLIIEHTFPVLSPPFPRLCMKLNLCKFIHLFMFWVTKTEKSILFIEERLLSFFFLLFLLNPLLLQHTFSGSNLKCWCAQTQYLHLLSSMTKGKGRKPWKLLRMSIYQIHIYVGKQPRICVLHEYLY